MQITLKKKTINTIIVRNVVCHLSDKRLKAINSCKTFFGYFDRDFLIWKSANYHFVDFYLIVFGKCKERAMSENVDFQRQIESNVFHFIHMIFYLFEKLLLATIIKRS